MFVPDGVLDHLGDVSDAPDLTGTRYRLVRSVGRGGMGAVFAAEDIELGREVAIKVSAPSTEAGELAERLRREARVIAKLEHPGIVPVHDAGVLPDGRVFYVMKLVRGERLDAWARARPDRRARLRLFQRICEAVAFANARGVVHRDLKPENVMVGEFGEALVMDWGIAKELRASVGARMTDTADAAASLADGWADTVPAPTAAGQTADGAVMGTLAYMAPEQARGHLAAIDGRTDVYGLGAILYVLVTDAIPFADTPVADVFARVRDGNHTPVLTRSRDTPKALAAICEKAMARSSIDRYATALDLAEDVGRFLDAEPVRAHPEGVIERVARFVARNRVVLSLLGAYLMLRIVLFALAR